MVPKPKTVEKGKQVSIGRSQSGPSVVMKASEGGGDINPV